MNLEEIEQEIQQRIAYLIKREGPTAQEEMVAYSVLALVKQAQASERIARVLENMLENGIFTIAP